MLVDRRKLLAVVVDDRAARTRHDPLYRDGFGGLIEIRAESTRGPQDACADRRTGSKRGRTERRPLIGNRSCVRRGDDMLPTRSNQHATPTLRFHMAICPVLAGR